MTSKSNHRRRFLSYATDDKKARIAMVPAAADGEMRPCTV
jgi:hypothetical protein